VLVAAATRRGDDRRIRHRLMARTAELAALALGNRWQQCQEA